MRKKVIEKLVREYVLPDLPGWEVVGAALFVHPIGACLSAVGFDTSGFDANLLNLDAYCDPLYLPPGETGAIYIKRLRGVGDIQPGCEAQEMKRIAAAIRRQAVPFLRQYDTPQKLAAMARQAPPEMNSYRLRAIGLSCAYVGDLKNAERMLELPIDRLRADGRAWCLAMADRLRAMVGELRADPKSFVARLATWRQENLRALGVSAYAGSSET
jgi:hypothetical protein